ncbi:DgyrCDS2450 [Dimorphilus gyrociliatus]|nr:DgyrCDS2450 [Dimorphilus gyrociliatus]
MIVVSNLISSGNFKTLSEKKYTIKSIIPEIQKNYNLLTQSQRHFIAVNAEDIFLQFIYEIGMIFDDATKERYVEITAAFQGLHGLADSQRQSEEDLSFQEYMAESGEKLYVTNYRFIREYTKGKDDVWVINRLNHFSPKEIVSKTGIFDR